jgi:uncharacterized protein (TIGR02246 family)
MHPTTPEACDALFAQHLNAGDVDAVAALYEPSGLLLDPSGAHVGHTAIRAALQPLAVAKLQLTMHVVQVLRAGDDLAVLYNDWTGTMQGDDGQPVALSGKAIEVVRRQPDGTWRFAVDDPYARG